YIKDYNEPNQEAASPFKNRNFIIVLIMLVMLFVMFPLTGQDKEQNLTRTEFLAMMGDSTKVITELSLQKTPTASSSRAPTSLARRNCRSRQEQEPHRALYAFRQCW
ncbi:hypothetical protein, partial [Fibrobacter sp. UWT3]|uniref:hypothetical protein n=1 Tax=Fibrobacter sp. UWT3 TaxID=1896225 RepID=UPI0020D10806